MVEITSHIVEHSELGQMHYTRFVPPYPKPDEIGVYFGGVNSRSSTIDIAGVAQVLAIERGIVIDVIDRPGNGLSTLPEDTALRTDYKNHGFTAVTEAIIDAQESDELFRQATKVRTAGMSLGGQIAVQYLDTIGDRAVGADLIDSAGLRVRAHTADAVGRYVAYLLAEMTATKLGKKPRIDELYDEESTISEAYNLYVEKLADTLVPIKQPREAAANEFRELCRLADGTGVDLAIKVMQSAVDEERPFELRASRSGARNFSDKGSAHVINEAFAAFDTKNQDNDTVSYGFLQDDTYLWHELAVAPSTVRKLITLPISVLQRRMR